MKKLVSNIYAPFVVLICHTKKKEKNKARLTFSNPNYNNGSGYSDEAHKSTFFKRLKYDRAQVSFIDLKKSIVNSNKTFFLPRNGCTKKSR